MLEDILKDKLVFWSVFVAAIIMAAVFSFSNTSFGILRAPEWTEKTGEGIFAPACSSSSPSSFCSGTQARATISWSYGGQHGSCNYANVSLSDGQSANSQACSGNTTFNVASNQSFTYSIAWHQTGQTYVCDSYDKWGGCISGHWVPYDNTIDTTSGNFSSPVCAPPVGTISGNPNPVNYGSSATVSWSSTDATSCTISPTGWTGTSGSQSTGPLTAAQTYTINCTGPGGSSQPQSVTIGVLPNSFDLSLGGTVLCNLVPLSWTASGASDAYRILRGSPRVDITPPPPPYTALNYSDPSVSQNTSYIYQIEAYNAYGTNRSNALNVDTPYCPPTLDFTATDYDIFQGQTSTLNWLSSYVTNCTASGAWSGSKALSGSQVVTPLPPPQVIYNLQCSGPGGSAQKSVTINVTELALPEFKEIIPR